MSEGLDQLRNGWFNNLNQDWQTNGDVILTVYCNKYNKGYELRVKDFGGPNERVLWEHELPWPH